VSDSRTDLILAILPRILERERSWIDEPCRDVRAVNILVRFDKKSRLLTSVEVRPQIENGVT
jgi:hypothetical protein